MINVVEKIESKCAGNTTITTVHDMDTICSQLTDKYYQLNSGTQKYNGDRKAL